MNTSRAKALGAIIGIPVLVIAFTVAWAKNPPDLAHLFSAPTVCEKPLTYAIGSIDGRFGVGVVTLQEAVTAAEKLWENGTGFDLLSRDDNASLKINLVFDERQIKTIEEARFKAKLDQEHTLYQGLVAQYDTLVAVQEKRLDEYNASGALYDKRLTNYNTQVTYWNSAGGAPEKVYNEFAKERSDLERLQQELENERQELNQQNANINALTDKINMYASTFNKSVDSYNTTFTEEQFEQGQYTGTMINVFQFDDLSDLEIVLAHEFGHAFGIDHLSNPTAIMYYLMEKQDTERPELTAEDVAALRGVCRMENSTSRND